MNNLAVMRFSLTALLEGSDAAPDFVPIDQGIKGKLPEEPTR